jgi:L-fucose isomerase-like protein
VFVFTIFNLLKQADYNLQQIASAAFIQRDTPCHCTARHTSVRAAPAVQTSSQLKTSHSKFKSVSTPTKIFILLILCWSDGEI